MEFGVFASLYGTVERNESRAVYHPFDGINQTVLIGYMAPASDGVAVINVCPKESVVSSRLPQLADKNQSNWCIVVNQDVDLEDLLKEFAREAIDMIGSRRKIKLREILVDVKGWRIFLYSDAQ
jgi:hypothetical protein